MHIVCAHISTGSPVFDVRSMNIYMKDPKPLHVDSKDTAGSAQMSRVFNNQHSKMTI